MRFGLHTGYWSAGPPPGMADAVAAADHLGLDSVWTAEAYGSDAFTPLAWWGASTRQVRLGTAIAQMYARTPTATAMAALTLDHLSGGRFVLGLGASGPQVVEGWYGQPYRRPLARTREYIEIVREVLAREAPLAYDGEFFQLPLRPEDSGSPHDDGAGTPGRSAHTAASDGLAHLSPTGLGRPLRSTVHPLRPDLPIHLAAEGPKNIALAAEIADGWLPLFYAPRLDEQFRGYLEEGFALRSPERSPRADFEVSAIVPVVVDDDVERAADAVRPFLALYIGGMGARGANFHLDAVARLGYGEQCEDIQRFYLAGDREGAAAAVPTELVQDIALVGPPAAIRESLATWESTAVTTMILQGDELALRTVLGA